MQKPENKQIARSTVSLSEVGLDYEFNESWNSVRDSLKKRIAD